MTLEREISVRKEAVAMMRKIVRVQSLYRGWQTRKRFSKASTSRFSVRPVRFGEAVDRCCRVGAVQDVRFRLRISREILDTERSYVKSLSLLASVRSRRLDVRRMPDS
jgi:hypothetical protein